VEDRNQEVVVHIALVGVMEVHIALEGVEVVVHNQVGVVVRIALVVVVEEVHTALVGVVVHNQVGVEVRIALVGVVVHTVHARVGVVEHHNLLGVMEVHTVLVDLVGEVVQT